jgi:hypothetical protein
MAWLRTWPRAAPVMKATMLQPDGEIDVTWFVRRHFTRSDAILRPATAARAAHGGPGHNAAY